MEKDLIKLYYAVEMEQIGIKEAFKKSIERVEKAKEESKEDYKKQYGDNSGFAALVGCLGTKMDYIAWTLSKRGFEKENKKEIIPLLTDELKSIIEDLEGLINE